MGAATSVLAGSNGLCKYYDFRTPDKTRRINVLRQVTDPKNSIGMFIDNSSENMLSGARKT